jgi:hypothetical protein
MLTRCSRFAQLVRDCVQSDLQLVVQFSYGLTDPTRATHADNASLDAVCYGGSNGQVDTMGTGHRCRCERDRCRVLVHAASGGLERCEFDIGLDQ